MKLSKAHDLITLAQHVNHILSNMKDKEKKYEDNEQVFLHERGF
jgi:hypothetical protein